MDNISPIQTNTGESSGFGFSINLSTAAPLTVGFHFFGGKYPVQSLYIIWKRLIAIAWAFFLSGKSSGG
jgi:hypothetical protein